MKKLTIFTPTYNRAYCLEQCYNSLICQSNKDFIWLVIDDGSNDNTKEIVGKWIDDGKIDIIYKYQENQGMHGAHNTAYDLIKTELCTCIDSDDFMAPEAVEKIISIWNNTEHDKNIAGIIGLDAYKNGGGIIGKKIPENIKTTTLEDLYHTHKIYGDKKIIYRTEIVKRFPKYPLFKNERFVPLGTLYLLIDKEYKLICSNEVFCIVEYLEDGSSRNIIKQYRRHPNGFRYARVLNMKNSSYFSVVLKNAVHYVSHSLFLKDWNFLFKSPKPLLTFFVFPFGLGLYIYTLYQTKDSKTV